MLQREGNDKTMSIYDYKKDDSHRRFQQASRRKRRRRSRALRRLFVDILKLGAIALAVLAVILLIVMLIIKQPWRNSAENSETQPTETASTEEGVYETEAVPVPVGDVNFLPGFSAEMTDTTVKIPKQKNEDAADYVDSSYAILINQSTDEIVAQRKAKKIINPASMTKVLTILVAAEHIEEADLDKKVKMTIEIADYVYLHDCSAVNFDVGEKIPVRDLFYGTILPSGADAALALANYVAGSEEAFVELMNQKLEELGLAETAHFTNCIGLYDENHYCTVYDMAMIMKAALENDFCREVLSAHTYTTKKTKKHKEGIQISNWFLRRIEDYDCGGEVLCAKTGYVDQSGSCAVSYEISQSGTPYICVTGKAHGSWRCIYDHIAIYSTYAK